MHQDDHTPGHAPGFSSLVDADRTERLSADDMATRREAEFLALALQAAARAASAPQPTGRCLYCRAQCAAGALFCDADCRADHAHEQLVLRRQGRAGGHC